MEQRRWWITPKQQEERNKRALKRAQEAIRLGTYQEPHQLEFAIYLNTRTNSGLPLPQTAPRLHEPAGIPPSPPHIPEDPNSYYRPPRKRSSQQTMATLYRREFQAYLAHKVQARNPEIPLVISPEEQEYLDNNPFQPR